MWGGGGGGGGGGGNNYETSHFFNSPPSPKVTYLEKRAQNLVIIYSPCISCLGMETYVLCAILMSVSEFLYRQFRDPQTGEDCIQVICIWLV